MLLLLACASASDSSSPSAVNTVLNAMAVRCRQVSAVRQLLVTFVVEGDGLSLRSPARSESNLTILGRMPDGTEEPFVGGVVGDSGERLRVLVAITGSVPESITISKLPLGIETRSVLDASKASDLIGTQVADGVSGIDSTVTDLVFRSPGGVITFTSETAPSDLWEPIGVGDSWLVADGERIALQPALETLVRTGSTVVEKVPFLGRATSDSPASLHVGSVDSVYGGSLAVPLNSCSTASA